MKVYRYPLGQMQANSYLLTIDSDCILVDPADSADFLMEQIQRNKLNLRAMIATHGHFDHVMAVGEIQLSFPDVPFYIHPKDIFLLDRLVETAKHFLDYDPVVIPIHTRKMLKKGKNSLHGFTFDVIETPGHTPGSCSLYFPNDMLLFTGDTLFAQGIGRSDFSYSDQNALMQSLKNILALPEDCLVYSGHGEESAIGQCRRIFINT